MHIPHSKPTVDKKEEAAVIRVLRSGHLSQGREVSLFESDVAKLCGVRYGVAVSSGSAALFLLLAAMNIGASDEVVLPSFSCSTFLSAVQCVGASPRLADISLENYNLDFSAAQKVITPKTKLIVLTHQFGAPGPVEEIKSLGVPVIEACAQGIGGAINGIPVGAIGTAGFFSFYATKLITTGEGGMAVTNNKKLADAMRDLRQYDEKTTYRLRWNYKMTDMAAAMGVVQLQKLPQFLLRRQQLAALYSRLLKGVSGIELPSFYPGRAWFRYVVKCKNIKERNRILHELNLAGIEAKVPLFKPLHKILGFSDREFPCTTKAWNTILSLPLFPSLTKMQVTYIANMIKLICS